MELKNICCNICGGKDLDFVGEPPIEERLLSKFPQLTKPSVVRCNNCGFYFIKPMPLYDKEELQFIYDNSYFEASNMTGWWVKKRNLDRISRLDIIEQTALFEVNKFLDVGCGEGFTLKEAQRRGWDVLGLDVYNNLDASLKSNFTDKILIGNLLETKFMPDSFDAIYLDSVLEHVPFPDHILKECYRILRRGGCIYVGIPNEDSLMNEVKRLFFKIKRNNQSPCLSPFKNPYHIVGFNRNCFRKIAKDFSFQVGKIRIFGGYYEFLKYYKSGWNIFLKSLVHSFIDFVGLLLGKGFYIEAWLLKK